MDKKTNPKSIKQPKQDTTKLKSASLKHIRNDRLAGSVETKLTNKKKVKKKEGQMGEEKAATFGSCLCLQQLEKRASLANTSINKHMSEKQSLIGDLQKCKFYMSNPRVKREPFLLEELQKRNMQIRFLQSQLKNKRKPALHQPRV